jgi:hypothetical protein
MSPCDNSTEMPSARHAVLDVVELVTDSGRWPAGTIGTVIEADAERALVEISDDRGHALDFIAALHDALVAAGDGAAERFASRTRATRV